MKSITFILFVCLISASLALETNSSEVEHSDLSTNPQESVANNFSFVEKQIQSLNESKPTSEKSELEDSQDLLENDRVLQPFKGQGPKDKPKEKPRERPVEPIKEFLRGFFVCGKRTCQQCGSVCCSQGHCTPDEFCMQKC